MRGMISQPRIFALIVVLAVISGAIYLYTLHICGLAFSEVIGTDGFNVLITGGAGFIGSHLVQHFEENESNCYRIFVIDDLSTGDIENIKNFKKVTLIQGSLDNILLVDRVMSRKIKFVFHLGAKISVSESFLKPMEYTQINTIGTLVLLDAAKKHGVESFVFASSSAIYGDGDGSGRPQSEDDIPNPVSPYGKTKLDGEFYVRQWADHKHRGVSLRCYNVFGERQHGSRANSAAVSAMIYRAMRNAPITINGDGEQTRDFIYVKDVVHTYVYAARNLTSGVYNVGYERSVTLNALASMIREKCKSSSSITYAPGKMGEIKKSEASTKKIRAQLWAPRYSLDEGLSKTIKWSLEKYK
jgi:UDP-glucose 4-epimerase